MNRISPSKTITFVFLFFAFSATSLVASWSRGQGQAPGLSLSLAPDSGKKDGGLSDYLDRQRIDARVDKCESAIKDIRSARSKFVRACLENSLSAKAKDCGEALDQCSEESGDEFGANAMLGNMIGGLTGGASGLLTTPNKCSSYTYTDYKSELKDLERSKKDAEKEVRELNKDNQKFEADYEKDKNRIQKAFIDDQEKRSEDQMKETEEERNAVSAEAESTDKLKEQLEQINTLILRTQGEKATLIASRAANVDNYKMKLIECKAKTREFERSMSSGGRSGSLKSAEKRAASNRGDLESFWETCAVGVLRQRDAEAEAFRQKISEYDDTINKATNALARTQAKIDLLGKQAAQAKNDRQVKRTKAEEAFQKKQMATYQELVSLDQQTSQKRIDFQNNLAQAKSAVMQESNNLASLQAQKPRSKGNKSLSDVSEAFDTYVSGDCRMICSGLSNKQVDACEKTMKEKDGSGVGSTSSSEKGKGAE